MFVLMFYLKGIAEWILQIFREFLAFLKNVAIRKSHVVFSRSDWENVFKTLSRFTRPL